MNSASENLKVVIVGDGGSGKTVLLWCYTGKEYKTEEYVPTVLETFTAQVAFGDQSTGVEIYDTAGQEDFVEIRNLVYPGTDVFIMCYSCVLHQSLQNIQVFWLPETRKITGAPFLLVGNKLDLKADLPTEYVEKEHGDLILTESDGEYHFQCSAKLESLPEKKTNEVQKIFKQALVVGIRNKYDSEKSIDDPCCSCCALL